jgi:type I restriction enzyme M protein
MSKQIDQSITRPEELVRQEALHLLRNYLGYRQSDIAVEFTIRMGSSRKRLDIAIFAPDALHTQENIIAIVECKRSDMRHSEKAVEQLKSYMAACINVEYGLVVADEILALKRIVVGRQQKFEIVSEFLHAKGHIVTFNNLIEQYNGHKNKKYTDNINIVQLIKDNILYFIFVVILLTICSSLLIILSYMGENNYVQSSENIRITSQPSETIIPIEVNIYTNTPTIYITDTPAHRTLSPTPTMFHTQSTSVFWGKVLSSQNINIRSGPGILFPVIGVFPMNQIIVIIKQSDDGEWYQVSFDDNRLGWVAEFLILSLPTPTRGGTGH